MYPFRKLPAYIDGLTETAERKALARCAALGCPLMIDRATGFYWLSPADLPLAASTWDLELIRRRLVARGWRLLPRLEAETWAGRGLPLLRHWPRGTVALVPPGFSKVPR